ncbi:MAG: multidrug efflux RND transporter permease subunit [Desulfovibrionaceae bacterium]|nr:multidrug efflux RND transporter permease subunit [Desulfovibrionaceae bacterium]
MISLAITLVGAVAIFNLPIEQYPNMVPVQVSVSASYNSATAETIAETVAQPLEQQINGVDNMIYMQSVSSGSGSMVLNVYFAVGTDPDQATINVNNRVQQALASLPQEVKRLGVTVEKQSPAILQLVTLTSPGNRYDTVYLSNYALLYVQDELKRLPGIGKVQLFGARDYSMRIWLKPDRMSMLGVTTTDITNAINEQNAQFATGRAGDTPVKDQVSMTWQFTTKGRLNKVEDFENIILRSSDEGDILRLKDVARVELGGKDYSFTGQLNGSPTQPIGIYLAPGANALATAEAVQKTMEELSKNFPEGVAYAIPFDTTTFVKVSINEVIHTLFEAIVLVICVVFIFLQNWRATLIPCLAVPISIVGTFAGMFLLGFSINTLTLFGLVLAIGIVVDDAIVVLENVERIMEEEGVDVYTATNKTMHEVTGPVIAIVLVLCSVFIPVAFLGGLAGQMYRQFAITIAVSVSISGLVALSFTPALCVLLLKPRKKTTNPIFVGFNKCFGHLTNGFTKLAGKILFSTAHACTFCVILAVGIWFLFVKTPTALVPDEDQGYVLSCYVLPEGASLGRTTAFCQSMEEKIRQNPLVRDVLTMSGMDILSGVSKTNYGTAFVMLKDWAERKGPGQSAGDAAMAVMGYGASLTDGFALAFTPPAITGMSNTGGFEGYLQSKSGASEERLYQVTQEFIAKCAQRPELGPIATAFNVDTPQMHLELDREMARSLGVSVSDVYDTIGSMFGVKYINDITLYGRTYSVRMQADADYRAHPEDLHEIYVRNKQGGMVPLVSMMTMRPGNGPQTLEHFNGFKAAKIMGAPNEGYSSGQALQALKEVAAELPEGFGLAWSGQAYQEQQSSGSTPLVFGLALVMVFMVLASQYESCTLPMAVLGAVPFAVMGALLANALRGYANDTYFQVALVTLVGLGAKNAILIVEFAIEQYKTGLNAAEAAMSAAKLRFRPVVMTSLAFILGCMPLAVSSGAGSGSRHAIGTAVVGGMLAATVLAPLFVPFFYRLVMRLQELFTKPKENTKTEAS